ncbi:MAG: penicillin-binding transpeptidase domain-containing protein [Candidatus Dojkabacteria bacterium]|nr:MAG: penicillin-binding transpeptidase domain-containing protein [Candidatus Dojkabacteria bacterium]
MNPRKIIEITQTTRHVPESIPAQYIGISLVFVVFLLSFAYLFYAGFDLSIVQGKSYAALANSNSVGKEAVFGERGMIVDREGKALVQNKKSYDIFIDPLQAEKQTIKSLFPQKETEIDKIFADTRGLTVILIHDAPKELVVSLKEKNLPGILLKHSYVRDYLNPLPFAHLLGYTGVASEADLNNNSSYLRNQIVGKAGLEFSYDSELQGELRYDTYEKDAFGNQVSATSTSAPASGQQLTLAINKKMQENLYASVKKAVDSNKAKGGSAVILDVTNGDVIALVSYPSYDINKFVGGISYRDYDKLIKDPQTPLLNRPIAAQEPPGSTFKTIVGVAALETGTITPETKILAPGVIRLTGGLQFQDFRRRYNGNLNIKEALMVSSNIFFCRSIISMGIEKFLPYAERFGIGKTTGIDLPGEMRGRLPSPENKIWLANNGATWLDPVWYPEGDSCNSAIGQGITLATPLQMAVLTAAIANGGTVYKPRVVQKITDSSGKVREKAPVVVAQDIASDTTLTLIRDGMRMSVAEARGVATALRYVPMKVAAKTGTAEFGVKDKNGYSTAHGWVIGFYPYEKPKYAFVMMVEGAGSSSVVTFAMRDFLNKK